jgi:hypothetical protein
MQYAGQHTRQNYAVKVTYLISFKEFEEFSRGFGFGDGRKNLLLNHVHVI